MTLPYRCSRRACRQRVTLRKPIEQYIRPRLCPACRHDSLRLDRWKLRDHRAARCHCDGYWFPHRRGSKWCSEYRGVISDADLEERYRSVRYG